MHRYIIPMTFSLLIAALFAAVGWLIVAPEFEPVITCLTLLTAITGLFIDRWLSEREHRRRLLRSLTHEIYLNLQVLKQLEQITTAASSNGPLMLPRFYNATLSIVIASGVFSTDMDSQLWKMLHNWLQRSNETNNRLTATEAYTLQNPASASLFYEKLSKGEVMVQTRDSLITLSKHLLNAYCEESGIEEDTVLFAVSKSVS
ncbi:hypothetical protein [Rubinisphaera sp.]|uniref:hypothetical protein n=1 Tax=Rubinisphaera sp. TaxID=2024857 RepID=UPI0025F7D614|nr:hypothetical protein [Rubinisphaera sp.]